MGPGVLAPLPPTFLSPSVHRAPGHGFPVPPPPVGPPLALLFNSQGLVKQDFRAGLALIRVAESVLTAAVYYHLGMFTAQSLGLVETILLGVLVGIPLGAFLIRHLDAETFRRVCM